MTKEVYTMLWQRIRATSIFRLGIAPLALTLFLGAAQAAPDTPAQANTQSAQPAEIIIHVSPDAVIWVDGKRLQSGGAERRFVTPPLQPGRKYSYDFQVSWTSGGRARTRDRHVSFQAGDRIVLDFAPPNLAEVTPGQNTLLVDPAAPNPSGTVYYEDPLNWPNYPNLRRWRGYYPPALYRFAPMGGMYGYPPMGGIR